MANQTKNEVVETTFGNEAQEEQQMTEKKVKKSKKGGFRGFVKRNWKTGALIVLSGLTGYGLGVKTASRRNASSDEAVPELPSGEEYQDTMTE